MLVVDTQWVDDAIFLDWEGEGLSYQTLSAELRKHKDVVFNPSQKPMIIIGKSLQGPVAMHLLLTSIQNYHILCLQHEGEKCIELSRHEYHVDALCMSEVYRINLESPTCKRQLDTIIEAWDEEEAFMFESSEHL